MKPFEDWLYNYNRFVSTRFSSVNNDNEKHLVVIKDLKKLYVIRKKGIFKFSFSNPSIKFLDTFNRVDQCF